MEDCLGVPQWGYGEFSQWLHKKLGGQRIPISGSFELTMRCNLRCQHCYVPLEQRGGSSKEELKLSEIKRILDEITEAGCLWLLLTGGEPLLRKDFPEIYLYAKHKGLILTLYTNGTLITPRLAQFLAEWRPFNIEITLYGASQETYENVTGIPGSYTRCRRGIDLLLRHNLPLGLKTMVMSLNRHELNQMKELASSLGVPFRFDPMLHPALDSSSLPILFRLSPEQIIELDKADPERFSLWKERFHQSQVAPISDHRMYICGAAKQSFHIDACGKVYPCMSARQSPINLRDSNFRHIWDQDLPRLTECTYGDDFPCLTCALRLVCTQCPAMTELEYGESEKRVEFICRVAKLRRDAFSMSSNV